MSIKRKQLAQDAGTAGASEGIGIGIAEDHKDKKQKTQEEEELSEEEFERRCKERDTKLKEAEERLRDQVGVFPEGVPKVPTSHTAQSFVPKCNWSGVSEIYACSSFSMSGSLNDFWCVFRISLDNNRYLRPASISIEDDICVQLYTSKSMLCDLDTWRKGHILGAHAPWQEYNRKFAFAVELAAAEQNRIMPFVNEYVECVSEIYDSDL